MMSQRGNNLGRPQPTTESQMMSPLVRYLMFILTGKTGQMAIGESIATTDRPKIYPETEAIMVGVTTMKKTKNQRVQTWPPCDQMLRAAFQMLMDDRSNRDGGVDLNSRSSEDLSRIRNCDDRLDS